MLHSFKKEKGENEKSEVPAVIVYKLWFACLHFVAFFP